MNKTRVIVFASVVAAAMIFGGVIGATAFARLGGVAPALAALSAASPTPPSNESASHEAGESAAQEAAENNGTARHGVGGRPCGGHSNEDATHEKGETAAREAAENAACPSPSPGAASTP